ncbi:MAG TPA: TatD family hydrolase [Clostridiales bacterium]|jgi:TatD DNase family protein|nr:TatD family hydrolase [Clostridiales bacterium]
MLFDSHAHLNSEGYTPDELAEVVRAIESSSLSYVVDVGFDLKSSRAALKHAENWPWCYAAIGCHPHDVKAMDDIQLAMLKNLARRPKAVAIGEIGLDYYRDLSPREDQQYWFRRQIQLANELRLPIVIHSRDADQDVLTILKEEDAFSPERCAWFPERPIPEGYSHGRDARVLLHCYSGSRELAEQYVRLGATISFAGPLTYHNNRRGVETAKALPLDYILIETDAPYLTPEPLRGRPNISPYVEHVARKLAEIKEVDYEVAAAATLANARRFFNI